MDNPLTAKHQEAIDSLPEDLRSVFDEFVTQYKYSASMRHGSPFVSYIVLSDMVKAGWRCSAEPCEE